MEVDEQVNAIINRIQKGDDVRMGDYLKNCVNAEMADRISIGDTVQVIRTGKIGIVTNKTVYDRKSQQWVSPHGYTTIQVKIGRRACSYAGRSLRILKRNGEN